MASTTDFLNVLDNSIASVDSLSSYLKADTQIEKQKRIHDYFNSKETQ